MSNVEEIKGAILKMLEGGPVRSGTLIKNVVWYSYDRYRENGPYELYHCGEICQAVYELYASNTIECCYDDEGATCYRLHIKND